VRAKVPIVFAMVLDPVGNGIVETCSPFVPLKVEEPYLKFKFEQAAVEQGKETPLLIKIEKRKDCLR